MLLIQTTHHHLTLNAALYQREFDLGKTASLQNRLNSIIKNSFGKSVTSHEASTEDGQFNQENNFFHNKV